MSLSQHGPGREGLAERLSLSQSGQTGAWRPRGRPPSWPRAPRALQSFPWRLSRGSGLALPHKERQYSIASALPKPCFFEDFCGPYAKASVKGPYFLTEYSTHQLFTQLTLLQQVRGGAGAAAVCWRDVWTHSGGVGGQMHRPQGAAARGGTRDRLGPWAHGGHIRPAIRQL